MDTFVVELRRKGRRANLEGKTQDVHAATTSTAPIPGIYLPLLPRYFQYTTSTVRRHSELQKAKEGCLNCIQDSLLQGQLQRAAELIISYIEMLEYYSSKEKLRAAPEEIWRIGTEILQRHPRSNIHETNHFADQMKNLGVKKYLKVSLEHAFHLLCNGFEDEAYQNLVLAESWKYGEQTVLQNKELKLIQGYRGLLDYSKWLKKKTDMLGLDEDSYAMSSIQQEMRILYRQAKVSLKEIIKIPGVWDPFVTSYVDMLEHYEEYEEAREVLSEYAYNSKFPPNPNAHVFLYQFLKRRGESRKTQRSALQILHELVPSHELMLEYYAMLKKSKKRKNQQLRLEVIFAALDSAGWKKNVKAWSCLAKEIVEILQNSDKQLPWLKNEWASRKDWWPALHFSLYLAKRDWQEDECLACEKVLVAGMLMGKDCKYFRYVMRQGCEANKKKFKPLKTFVKKHSLVSLKTV